MILVADFLICYLDRAEMTLLYSLHWSWVSCFIGILLARWSTDGSYDNKLVLKLLNNIISHIHLGFFKVLPITVFHVDAAPTWYMLLVLGGEEF